LLLGITAANPARANVGADRAQLLLEHWAVQAALRRRRGSNRLTEDEHNTIRRCTRDPAICAAREHAHGQEETGTASDPARAVERGAAARHHAMNVRMVLQGLTPGMEHRGNTDLRAQMLWIGGDGGERLSDGAEQDRIDGGLVLEGDLARQHRQGEDDVEVRHR
jgi:hypothetical protein